MYRIIGGDQKEYGPVTADELRRWIAEGRLNGQSLAWAEGTPNWRPLSSFPEFAEALAALSSRLPTPAAGPAPADAALWSARILARPPEIQIGRCLALSWNLLKANSGLLIGATFLIGLTGLICQFLPVVGILYWVIRGVFYGGLYVVFLRRIRGQPATIGDSFAGFGPTFGQLLLAGFLSTLLGSIGFACCLLPGIYLLVAWIFSVPLVADQRLEFWSAMELSRKVVTRVWFEILALVILAFVPYILMYLFAQVLIFRSVWPMMQDLLQNTSPDIGRLIQSVMHIMQVSLPLTLLTKIVLLFNLPFALGALMYAYESLFGARTTPTA